MAAQLFGDRAALVFTRIDSATLRQATRDVRDFGVVVSEEAWTRAGSVIAPLIAAASPQAS